jgi:chromosome segregation ATPase
MEEIQRIENKIHSLNKLILDGEIKFEEDKEKLIDLFFKKLKPKKFKTKWDRLITLGDRKNYKGYLLNEIEDLGNQFLNKNDGLVNLLKVIRNARAALYQLNKDYNSAVSKFKESNKKYAKIELKTMKVEKNEGSSMPNYPWERVFKSKGY